MAIDIKVLKGLLIEPHKYLTVAEKENIETTIVVMCLNWILITIGASIFLENFAYSPLILVMGIITQLVFSFFLNVALILVGGKGSFKNVLDSLTYPYFGFSFIFFLLSIIKRTASLFIPIIGIVVFPLYLTIGIVGSIRMLKDTFKTEILTVWVIGSLTITALVLSIYLIAALSYPSFLKSLFSLF